MSENTETESSLEVLQPSALHALERAQIDTQVATAHQYPRSIQTFKQRALGLATLDEETAESCIYCRPVGKEQNDRGQWVEKFAEGASIRLAEIVACSYGNIRVASRIVEQTPRYVKCEGVAHDLESNYAGKSETVESTTKKDGTPYSERQRALVAKVALAKAFRDAIFKVVPRALCKPILDAAKKVAAGQGLPVEARRKKAQAWLVSRKIEEARAFAVLGVKGWADVNDAELTTLTGLKTAVMDGDPIDEIFPPLEGQAGGRTAAPTAFQQATQPAAPAAPPSNVTPLPAQPAPTTAAPAETVQKKDRVKRRANIEGPGTPHDAPAGVQTPPTPSEAPPAPASEQPAPVQEADASETGSDEAEEAAAGLAPVQQPPAAPVAPAQEAPPTPVVAPFTPRAGESEGLTSIRLLLHRSSKTEDQILAWLRANKAAKDGQKLSDLSETKLINTGRAFNSFLTETSGESKAK